MSSAFSASGDDVIARELHCQQSSTIVNNSVSFQNGKRVEETLEEAYEIQRCVSWIKEVNVSTVALQFPDELLVDAPDVALAIEQKSGIEVYILGDTSYGSCCVDEITAEHVGADSLIHFGHACLSQNKRLPTLYVFENLNVEQESFVKVFHESFPSDDERLLLVSDLKYDRSTSKLLSRLHGKNVIHLKPDISFGEGAKGNLVVAGRNCNLPADSTVDEWKVLYIGEEGATLTNLMLILNRCTFYTYNPKSHILRKETLNVNQQLRKRYYLIEKAKDAQLIGILVATLGVANYLEIIERIKALITNAGKKYYTFVVGKLNPSKLANFPEIDCYTIVACAENSLINSKDFYRPVITPFELEVALNNARSWTGDYVTDFRQLLPGAADYIDLEMNPDGIEPDVSLVSGRIRSLQLETVEPSSTSSGSQLSSTNAGVLSTLPSASDYLNQRQWQGLTPRVGETPVTIASAGRSGLAAGYINEGDEGDVELRGKPDGHE